MSDMTPSVQRQRRAALAETRHLSQDLRDDFAARREAFRRASESIAVEQRVISEHCAALRSALVMQALTRRPAAWRASTRGRYERRGPAPRSGIGEEGRGLLPSPPFVVPTLFGT